MTASGRGDSGADLLAHSEPLHPEDNGSQYSAAAGAVQAPGGILVSDVETERVAWLWRGWLALGKISVLDGDPGLGKSATTLDIAARLSTGRPFPDGSECETGAGGVLILSAEDGLADTIKPRLEAAGADTSRISSLGTVWEGRGERRHGRTLSLPEDIPLIEREVRRVEAKLVICCPDAGNANANTNTTRKAAPANVDRKCGTPFLPASHVSCYLRHINASARTVQHSLF